jgi:GntR family transcriptional regulator
LKKNTDIPEIDPLGNPEPVYLQVANVLAASIRAGRYDRRLPSERELAKKFEVSYQTLRHAMDVLRARGIIVTQHGRGTFIVPTSRTGA